MTTFLTVDSSNIQEVGYDAANMELHVRFHSGPAVYVYRQVPKDVHTAFLSAASLGRYFHRFIKNTYTWYKQ